MEYGAVRTNFDYMATFGRLSVLENAPLTSHEPENDADSFIYIWDTDPTVLGLSSRSFESQPVRRLAKTT